jgi:hypothetical protein
VIDESSAPRADRLCGNSALMRKQAKSYETFRQFAVGLFAHEFVANKTPPEIDPGAVEELAGDAAEKLNQRICVGAFCRFRGNAQKEFLKGVVGINVGSAFR